MLPNHFTSLILFGWGMYHFINKGINKKLSTWKTLVKGIGLMFLAVLANKFLNSLDGDIDVTKVDGFISVPLFILTIILIAKLLNKKGEGKFSVDMTTRQSGERRGDLCRSPAVAGRGIKKARASRLTGSQVNGE